MSPACRPPLRVRLSPIPQSETAPVVRQLLSAGAVLVGKTNLDQFAAGLVGTRSPYGVPRNPFDARYIPGGSSSGSAVAVAAGLVSFALGTDTAGSGRVPAAFNNIVGLKPTRGLLSTRGVVPACRSLDCVSVFALSAQDACAVLDVAACFDLHDPLAREAPSAELRSFGPKPRFGVPPPGDLEFFGDHEAESLFAAAIAKLEQVGGTRAEAAFAPFRDAGRLLYDGPWLAERLHATQALLDDDPDAILPVTRSIIEKGRHYSALDAYRAQYELARLKREADLVFAIDRRAAAADHWHDLRDSCGCSGPVPPQCQSRSLYEFREPARSDGDCGSCRVSQKRAPLRDFVDRSRLCRARAARSDSALPRLAPDLLLDLDDVLREDHLFAADAGGIVGRGQIAGEDPDAVERVRHDLGGGAVDQRDPGAGLQRSGC